MVKITGEEVAKSYRNWVTQQITASTQRIFDLGKFLFSVSVATLVLITGFVKAFTGILMTVFFILFLLFIGLSIKSVVQMLLPKMYIVSPNIDLQDEYRSQIEQSKKFVKHWIFWYLLGLCFGITALLIPIIHGLFS